MPGGPLSPDEVLPLLRGALQRVGEESGIDFTVGEPPLRIRPSGTAASAAVWRKSWAPWLLLGASVLLFPGGYWG
jgi:hypothetical protein